MSPTLPADGFRAVLTWNEQPLDVDSWAKFGTHTRCQVDWAHTNRECDGAHVVLDVDDTKSYGPETTSFFDTRSACANKQEGECLFKFTVHDYSANPTLS